MKKEASSRGAIKIDCPHCNKRILLRKMRDGCNAFGGPKYSYLLSKDGRWIPAKEEDRK